jgi:hypothetical protein
LLGINLKQDRPVLLCILKWTIHMNCMLVAPHCHYWPVHWEPSRYKWAKLRIVSVRHIFTLYFICVWDLTFSLSFSG